MWFWLLVIVLCWIDVGVLEFVVQEVVIYGDVFVCDVVGGGQVQEFYCGGYFIGFVDLVYWCVFDYLVVIVWIGQWIGGVVGVDVLWCYCVDVDVVFGLFYCEVVG